MSCSEDGVKTGHGVDYQYGRNLSHEKIVLGSRLENPYKTENITKALQELYPTKADRVEVKTTDLYVRFLPKSDSEYEILKGMDIHLTDHPLDFEIVKDELGFLVSRKKARSKSRKDKTVQKRGKD
jgi:hypothetical protein